MLVTGNTNIQQKLRQKGMTLLELIIATSILLILSSAALPLVRHTIVGQKETELRHDLREMRDAIDRYKDLADQGGWRILPFFFFTAHYDQSIPSS